MYSKALKLSGLGSDDEVNQESNSGTLTNLMSEDTFNIMSCYWIGHYVWAIPLKVTAITICCTTLKERDFAYRDTCSLNFKTVKFMNIIMISCPS